MRQHTVKIRLHCGVINAKIVSCWRTGIFISIIFEHFYDFNNNIKRNQKFNLALKNMLSADLILYKFNMKSPHVFCLENKKTSAQLKLSYTVYHFTF